MHTTLDALGRGGLSYSLDRVIESFSLVGICAQTTYMSKQDKGNIIIISYPVIKTVV